MKREQLQMEANPTTVLLFIFDWSLSLKHKYSRGYQLSMTQLLFPLSFVNSPLNYDICVA